MEESWCEVLRLQAIPHICIPGGMEVLQIDGMQRDVSKDSIPPKLGDQLSRLNVDKSVTVDYFTIFHVGRSLQAGSSEFVQLELMPQPYVFFDAKDPNRPYESKIRCGIYTIGIQANSIRAVDKSVQVNPTDIMNCYVNVKFDYNKQLMQGNTRFDLSLVLPVQVFYTLYLIEFNNQIVRVAICKNVVTVNESNSLGRIINRLAQAETFSDKVELHSDAYRLLSLISERSFSVFDTRIFEFLTETLVGFIEQNVSAWCLNRFKYYVWHLSGEPKGDPNFGENEYMRLHELSVSENAEKFRWKWSTEFLNKCFDALIMEIFNWIREI